MDALDGSVRDRHVDLDDPDGSAVEAVLTELDAAHEELQVADAEINIQREEIERLLGEQRSAQWWHERLVSTLPVAVLVTDDEGRISSANSAAAVVLGIQVVELLRKPLQAYVEEADRGAVRAVLHGRGGDLERLLVTLRPGRGPAHRAQLVASRRGAADGAVDVTWVLLPTSTGPDSPAPDADRTAVARAVSELVSLPVQAGDLHGYLADVAGVCQHMLPAAAAVSVTVGSPLEPDVLASDSLLAQQFDAAQMRAGDGPCQEAWRTGVVVTDDVRTDPRWPGLAAQVETLGVAGVLAVPVRAGDEPVGVINAYAVEVSAFESFDETVAELLASTVAAVLRHVEERDSLRTLADQLQEAMRSRAVIEQAKGMVMVRFGCGADEAFKRLVRTSRNQNIKLREVARMLVESGASPQ